MTIKDKRILPQVPGGMEAAIPSIASDLQIIMGEAMTTAMAIFPQTLAAPKKDTLTQHLWPKSVQRDVDKGENPPTSGKPRSSPPGRDYI